MKAMRAMRVAKRPAAEVDETPKQAKRPTAEVEKLPKKANTTTPTAMKNDEAAPKANEKSVVAVAGDCANRMTKMVNALQYHSEYGKDKKKSDQAKTALKHYFSIQGNGSDAQAKRRDFLATFETTGGKGKDGLKWAVEYSKAASHENKNTIASLENLFVRLA